MKQVRTTRIGQLIGLGFGLILLLALLIGLMGRIAYDVSKQQNNTIQARGDVANLSLELEMLAIQRTDALRRYLESETDRALESYQEYQKAYQDLYDKLIDLLYTPQEVQALNKVKAAEADFDAKAQEMLRLYEDFPNSAYFLWTNEGRTARDNLLKAIQDLRQTQGNTSTAIIEQAHYIENLTIIIISICIFLVLIGGSAASLIITRKITTPILQLVTAVSALGSDLTTRVKPAGPKEIAFLGETINDMAANLLNSRQSLQTYKERLEKELALASKIQASFLPKTLPQLPGLELAIFWQAAREMGGDFYVVVESMNGQRGLAVGDVSGKGTAAAMAGALSVGLLEAYAATHHQPEALLSALNRAICLSLAVNQINVACCYAIFNESLSCLTLANAGGVYPYLRRGHDLHEIPVTGLPLGSLLDFDYTSLSLPLHPGDLIIFSSDGLVEAKNEQGQMFGFERLQTEIMNLPLNIKAQTAVDHLAQLALEFTGPQDLHDDITILAVRIV